MKRTAHHPALGLLSPAIGVLALVCAFLSGPALAELPGEVTGLNWCPATEDCLTWSVTPGAAAYDLHRGSSAGLAGLLDGSLDSCTVGSYDSATTGPGLRDEPASGRLDWYLVTARNAEGEGSAGSASSGLRSLDSTGACVAGSDLVINEIDYDQAGSDQGEFVEIYNARPTARNLGELVLILVNGDTGEEYRRYDLTEAGASLGAGAYLVIGSSNVLAALPPGTLSIPFGSSSNNLQNGAPDGVALFDTGTNSLLDALSYEGSITEAQLNGAQGPFNLVEGTEATAHDSNSTDGSLSRVPNGADTDDADSDWRFVVPSTPGAANAAP